MVEALFIHKNLEQQDLGLLEVSERLAKPPKLFQA
jgi:hypothetical protein